MSDRDAAYWRRRAARASAEAETARDPVVRRLLFELAETLERIADDMERPHRDAAD
jgi:hypothetical protein